METNKPNNQATRPATTNLPVEQGSESELLSSSHVFAISPIAVDATAWAPGSDGLEHREIRAKAKLAELFKGQLAIKSGDLFSFTVQQRRESEFVENDYHGLWSYVHLTPGAEYVIVSRGATNQIAELLQEGLCQAVFDASYIADVKAAIEGERIYRAELARAIEPDAGVAAAHALLSFASERRSTAKDLFGRYLWARLLPVFLRSEQSLAAPVLRLIQTENATVGLRGVLISGIYEATLLLEPNPDLSRTVTRAFFAVLEQKSAAPLAGRLVEAQLYNLVLREGNVDVPVETIFPEQSERDTLRKALEPFTSERAHELSRWLAQPVPARAK